MCTLTIISRLTTEKPFPRLLLSFFLFSLDFLKRVQRKKSRLVPPWGRSNRGIRFTSTLFSRIDARDVHFFCTAPLFVIVIVARTFKKKKTSLPAKVHEKEKKKENCVQQQQQPAKCQHRRSSFICERTTLKIGQRSRLKERSRKMFAFSPALNFYSSKKRGTA